jgi:hypothetical protein
MKNDNTLIAMTRTKKLKHIRDGIFNAIAHAAKEGLGNRQWLNGFVKCRSW